MKITKGATFAPRMTAQWLSSCGHIAQQARGSRRNGRRGGILILPFGVWVFLGLFIVFAGLMGFAAVAATVLAVPALLFAAQLVVWTGTVPADLGVGAYRLARR